MSYEVTATRRRPQRFEDLVGQEFVAETLKNSIKSGKIAHAYLFAGPRGCGKTSSARILAKALNCQNGPTQEPCGQCSNCLEITKGSSLDVIEIDGASNTSVENIRQIKEEVMFPPNSSKYKIYIIDEVHMLSTSAFNALLKTIEEPPAHVIFIFATTELQKVPATIKSRCQQYNFRLVPIDKVKQCLAEAAAELNIQADDEALFWIAKESTGSMRDAYTLFDQVVAFSDGHITYEKIRDKLGLVGIDRLNTIFEACAQNQTESVINLLDEFLQAGVSIEQLISNSADYLRSLLLLKSGVKKESLLGNSPERYSAIVLQAWNPVQIERALSIFLQLYRDIRYSLSPRYELELAFSRLCWIGQYVSSAEVKKAIDAAQALLAGTPVNTSPVNNARVIAPATNTNVVNTATSAAPVSPNATVSTSETTGSTNASGSTAAKPGLPRFSMLDKMEANPELYENNDPDSAGDESHPFSNGGSLPPEQSVEAPENTDAVEAQPAPIDERLTIHINSTPAAELTRGTYFVPTSTTGYTENPDAEPSEDFSADSSDSYSTPSEAQIQAYEQEYINEAQHHTSQPQIVNIDAPVQLNDSFTTADGRTLSIAQLRGNVTATLSISEGFTSSLLERTGEWIITSDTVETTVATQYDLSLIEKKYPLISSEISKIFGKTMAFKSKLMEVQQNNEERMQNIPEQAKVLMDIFRGTIVAGK